MNIWALDKDLSIKHLLLLLTESLGPEGFCISDEAALNAMSVRVHSAGEVKMSAYIYTYGQDAERYGVHLEYPSPTDMTSRDTIEMQENIEFDQLLALLQVHLM